MEQLKDQEKSIISLVESILHEAAAKRASDIHIEPLKLNYRIRYRIDGLLITIKQFSHDLGIKIIARVKILANLDIAERRLPQDGSFCFTTAKQHNIYSQQLGFRRGANEVGWALAQQTSEDERVLSKAENHALCEGRGSNAKSIECRISTCPTHHGEKAMLRLLEKDKILHPLGMHKLHEDLFFSALRKPNGFILVTGPTGSGKSTTLYHAINYLNTTTVNICTAEDPIEVKLPGVNQVNIQPKIGLTFLALLRAFLRQDPDIIMIGEIRDHETAEMALRASQTGHLVLSTLHSKSSITSLFRLKNMGVPISSLAGNLNLIIAQRLLRRLCHYCKKPSSKEDKSYAAVGCMRCQHGYNGRMPIFEMLPIDKTLDTYMQTTSSLFEIEQFVTSMQIETLYAAGLAKLNQGETSLEELHRVVTE